MATNSSFLTGNYQAASAPNTVGWGKAPTDIKNLPNALMQQGWNMASQPVTTTVAVVAKDQTAMAILPMGAATVLVADVTMKAMAATPVWQQVTR